MPEDMLILRNKWRLLVPLRTSRTVDWENGVFLAKPEEIYKMPKIVVYLVKAAIKTGGWETECAINEFFMATGAPEYSRMVEMVSKMIQVAKDYRITSIQIRKVAEEFGLGERVDPLIAELKSAGLLSPRWSLFTEALKKRAPFYEINPSISARKYQDSPR